MLPIQLRGFHSILQAGEQTGPAVQPGPAADHTSQAGQTEQVGQSGSGEQTGPAVQHGPAAEHTSQAGQTKQAVPTGFGEQSGPAEQAEQASRRLLIFCIRCIRWYSPQASSLKIQLDRPCWLMSGARERTIV